MTSDSFNKFADMPQLRLGTAALTRMAYQGDNLVPLTTKLLIELAENPQNTAPLMDLSVIEQLKGNATAGLSYQNAALAKHRLYRTQTCNDTDIELLVLAAPSHMGGNTPVEFLLEGRHTGITTLYMVPGTPLPDPLPAHDIALIAAPGDKGGARDLLLEIDRHLAHWPRPLVNLPAHILPLDRDELWRGLAGIAGLVMPRTDRFSRAQLAEIAQTHKDSSGLLAEFDLPLVIRPLGSHAGHHLCKLDRLEDLGSYLEVCLGEEFFVSQFINYRGIDGLFRKYRIVFIDGQPFPCHMAIAENWDVWYLNANMEKSAVKRTEEKRFFQRFDSVFARRHRKCFKEITQRIKLDYFGIDCAETRSGDLVLFEADNAMIVHDMDSADLFPYKKQPMQRIFTAFETMLLDKVIQDINTGAQHAHSSDSEIEQYRARQEAVL